MKNNIINEVTLIKKLMLINEATIKFKFGLPKITKELDALGDNDIKGWNLDVKKENPYRQGAMITEKIDTKAKLLNELNELNNVSDLQFLKNEQKQFLKDLNERLETVNSKYVEELADSFKIDFKNADDATRGKFLNTYKQLLENNSYIRFEKRLQGITIKGVLPFLKYIIKGSVQGVVPLMKTWNFWIFFSLGTTGVLGSLYSLLKRGGDVVNKKIEVSLKTKGAELFKLLLNNQDIFLSNFKSEDIAISYGITEENKVEIDNYAQDFFNTKSWFDTTTGEVEELFKTITTNFDGINFIYFLSKFKQLSGGKSLKKFLFEQGIPNIENIIFSENSINPDFEFLTVMASDVATLNSLNIVNNAVKTSYGDKDGYSQMLIKQDSRNENSEWEPFNNPNENTTLNFINSDGETISFDYTKRTEILNQLKMYMDGIWTKAGSIDVKEKITNLYNEIINDKKVPTSDDLLKLSLSPEIVYTDVSAELMKDHPEFNKIKFTWPWVLKENVVGLARILKEEPVLGKTKKKVDNGNNQNTQNVLPSTPFKTQAEGDAFRAWVRETDAAYATQINLSATGPFNNNFIRNAYKKYGTLYQNSLSNSGGGNIQQPETVDKAKEIFDKFNDSVFFRSVNNEPMNIEYTPEIAKKIKYLKGLNYNDECSYLGAILALYGKIISKYKTDINTQNNIDTHLPYLQKYLQTINESLQLKRPNGLARILEQVSDFVTVYIDNGVPRKENDDDKYKDMSNVTIKSIIGGGTELRKGDRSDTIVRVKEALGYDKDTTPYFTQDFDTFVIKYKGENELDNSNSNISRDLICSIKQYQQLCSTSSGQKTTAPPTNTSIPIELKYLNDFATAVGNGVPSYDTCKKLFDYYSEQALNYIRLKKVNKEPKDTEGIKKQLEPIKDKILYCQKSSDLKDRAKLDTLISQRFRIQQGDKDNPYKMDI
jgi:hypothetical protein